MRESLFWIENEKVVGRVCAMSIGVKNKHNIPQMPLLSFNYYLLLCFTSTRLSVQVQRNSAMSIFARRKHKMNIGFNYNTESH